MKKYNPDFHHRQSLRLKNYDYAQAGLYFITICVNKHQCMFGNIIEGNMRLNEIGAIVCNEWFKTAELRSNVQLHNFVVMPNHFHGILEITDMDVVHCVDVAHRRGVARNAPTTTERTETKNEYMSSISPKAGEMGAIIRAFKSAVTKNIRLAGFDFRWQRNLYEHIIRDNVDYDRIDNYIASNPVRWKKDIFFST